MNPPCKLCGAQLLRWAWYEAKAEPVEYWYCLECDKVNREPCIQVLLTRGGTNAESNVEKSDETGSPGSAD